MDIPEFIYAAMRGVGILFLLNLMYFIIFKLIRWKSHLLKIILTRVRVIIYILLNILLLWWCATLFPPTRFTPIILHIFEVLFVVLSGVMIIETLNVSFFDHFIPRKGDTLPIYRQLTIIVVYSLFLYGLLGWLLRVDIPNLLTTSAILSVAFGLALQDTLGNLFAGLALYFSRPYQIGDWIKVGDCEGQLIRIDWRSISLRTVFDTNITLPHSNLAKREIQNYTAPTPDHGRSLTIGVHYKNSPFKVKTALLDILASTAGVLKSPPPLIRLFEYGEHTMNYRMFFIIDEFTRFPQITTDIMEKIWYKFKREEIEFAFPIRNIYMQKPEEGLSIKDKVALLNNIDFLTPLDDAELEHLAASLKIKVYHDGETIFEQGEIGDTFYYLRSGKIVVSAFDEHHIKYLDREMPAGSFFGEISLLTGETRTATVKSIGDVEVYTLTSEDLSYLIKQNPEICTSICEALAMRQRISLKEKLKIINAAESEAHQEVQKTKFTGEELLKKIRYFFSY